MVEVKLGLKTMDLPYTVRIPGISEDMFDQLVDEDTKAELIDGVMIVHSPASPRHGNVSGFMRTLMRMYAEGKRLGLVLGPECLVHLATCRKFAPDIFFYKKGHYPRRLPKKQFEGTPKLVTEVLSPSNRLDDLEDKWPAYREAGVDEIWIVDLDESKVLVDRRGDDGYTTTVVHSGKIVSTAIRGFWIEAGWLWKEPLPNDWECWKRITRKGSSRS